MNVRMTGRPWNRAREIGCPAWSVSEKSGAGRAPAAQVIWGAAGAGGPVGTACGDERDRAIRRPASTPSASAATRTR
jgi:hypothetical protein